MESSYSALFRMLLSRRAKTGCLAAPRRGDAASPLYAGFRLRSCLAGLRPLPDAHGLAHEIEGGKAQGKQKAVSPKHPALSLRYGDFVDGIALNILPDI